MAKHLWKIIARLEASHPNFKNYLKLQQSRQYSIGKEWKKRVSVEQNRVHKQTHTDMAVWS